MTVHPESAASQRISREDTRALANARGNYPV